MNFHVPYILNHLRSFHDEHTSPSTATDHETIHHSHDCSHPNFQSSHNYAFEKVLYPEFGLMASEKHDEAGVLTTWNMALRKGGGTEDECILAFSPKG